ncbi:MAG: hypothetical protein MJH09_12340 [Cetobacterium sp.]|nr:hypothetical protein [Cetobacterium sp.]
MKRVVLLAGHNFENQGYEVVLDGTRVTEFNLTTWLVAEGFKRERLMKIDLVIKVRNDYRNLVKEVTSLNGQILISYHFNAANGEAQGIEVLHSSVSKK